MQWKMSVYFYEHNILCLFNIWEKTDCMCMWRSSSVQQLAASQIYIQEDRFICHYSQSCELRAVKQHFTNSNSASLGSFSYMNINLSVKTKVSLNVGQLRTHVNQTDEKSYKLSNIPVISHYFSHFLFPSLLCFNMVNHHHQESPPLCHMILGL